MVPCITTYSTASSERVLGFFSMLFDAVSHSDESYVTLDDAQSQSRVENLQCYDCDVFLFKCMIPLRGDDLYDMFEYLELFCLF